MLLPPKGKHLIYFKKLLPLSSFVGKLKYLKKQDFLCNKSQITRNEINLLNLNYETDMIPFKYLDNSFFKNLKAAHKHITRLTHLFRINIRIRGFHGFQGKSVKKDKN